MESYISKKFYVPDISEFHVGFEYEIKTSSGIWISTAANNLSAIRDIIETFEEKDIRVKYLDKEDIESLGWEFEKEDVRLSILNFKLRNFKLSYDLFEEDKYNLILSISEHVSTTSQFRFISPIKNKSELKKLMKQLNIEG